MKKVFVLLLGIVMGVSGSFVLDRGLDILFTRLGYFKALVPNVFERFDTSEFHATSTTSSQGIRNEEVTVPKPKNVFRVLALGDSFTFGWGVNLEESWPKLLEKRLSLPGKSVEVINAGAPGANIRDLRFICRAYQDWFDVDAIVVGFYFDNLYQSAARWSAMNMVIRTIKDLWPTLTKLHEPVLGVRYWGPIPPGSRIVSSEVWKNDSADFLKRNPQALGRLAPTVRPDIVSGKLNPGVFYLAIQDPLYFMYVVNDSERDFAMQSTAKSLARFERRCGKRDIPVIMVGIPSQEIVSTYYHPFKKELGYVVDERLVSVSIDDYLVPLMHRFGYQYISAVTNFRSDGCETCYYPYDSHFTKEGNRRLVEIIAPEIQKILDTKTQ